MGFVNSGPEDIDCVAINSSLEYHLLDEGSEVESKGPQNEFTKSESSSLYNNYGQLDAGTAAVTMNTF